MYQCELCGAHFQNGDPGLPNTPSKGKKLYSGAFCALCYREEYIQESGEKLWIQLNRAKKAGTLATLTIKQWLLILHYFHWSCAYCGGPYQSMDHVIPLSKGGGTTADNCVPCCASCNPKKGNRSLEEAWIPQEVIDNLHIWLTFQKRAWGSS